MQKITLIGNLGKDIEEKKTSSGKRIMTFSLAVKVGKDAVQWYNIVIWEDKISLFNSMLSYMKKGSRILVMGDLNLPNVYVNKKNETVINLSVNPFSMSFISSGEEKQKIEQGQKQETELPFKAEVPVASWESKQEAELPF